MKRVLDVTMSDPGSPGTVPQWEGASAGDPLLVHSLEGNPAEYIVPAVKRGKTLSLVGVSASDGEWSWYTSVYDNGSFPLTSAAAAKEMAEDLLGEYGIDIDVATPRAIMAPDTGWLTPLKA